MKMPSNKEEFKGKKGDQLKGLIREYVDKYYVYQELENKLKFLDYSEEKLDLASKRDKAREEWKKVADHYNELLGKNINNN
jgi:hypothetical protein